MPPTIREPASEAERAQAIDVRQELWRDASRERVAGFLDEPGYHALCAIDADGSVLGVAGVSVQRVLHHERHAWVHDLVVTEARRGDGLGRDLMAAVEDWTRERDLDLVALATIDENDAAREFYEGTGYDEWGSVHERRL